MAFFGVFVWLCFAAVYALFCNLVLYFLLTPLELPESLPIEKKRAQRVTFLIYLSFGMLYFGVIIMLAVYALGVYRHVREHQNHRAGTLPRIPRVALSELLTMVFSVGFFPVIVSAIFQLHNNTTSNVIFFVLSIAIFPICFVSAYYRLDGNHVPLGRARLAFLFIYPYLILAVQIFVVGGFILFASVLTRSPKKDDLLWLIAPLTMALGALLAKRAKTAAILSVDDTFRI